MASEPIESTWTYQLGVHSNIPACCARFYVERQRRLGTQGVVALNARRGLMRDWKAVQYVMCTKCLRAFRAGRLTPATLHICTDSLDGPICHRYLSGPDRVAGLPIKERYARLSSGSDAKT